MDWNRVEGNWKQFKGKAKEKWGKLTDDDLNVIEGRRDQLEGKLQQRYGFAKDQVHKDVDDWFKKPRHPPGLFVECRTQAQNTAMYFSNEITPRMITITRAICLARPSIGNRLIR